MLISHGQYFDGVSTEILIESLSSVDWGDIA